ncbi:MAG: NAD-binding protein [Candidatus Lokiarchaeota archaeon]|nr:NAD-binding protein [Candidatus Lokiarchaeota archaeon]
MIKVILIVFTLNIILAGIYSLIEGIPFHLGFYWISDYITNTGTGLISPDPTDPHDIGLWWLTSAVIWIGLGITLVFVENVYLRFMRKEEKVVKFHNHIILAGWNAKMRYLIENLSGELGVHHDYVLININEERPYDLPDIIEFISGSPLEERVLRQANIESADQAVIVMEDDADALMLCSTLQHMNPDAGITVNVLFSENIKHFQRIDVEEIICDEELSGDALVQGFYRNKKRKSEK